MFYYGLSAFNKSDWLIDWLNEYREYFDDEFLYAVNRNYVAICNGLAAILNTKLLSAKDYTRAPNYRIVYYCWL